VALTGCLSDRDFVWMLGSLCQLHRIPFDSALLLQQFPPPYDWAAVLRAAQALDFKVGERTVGAGDLAGLPLPCVAFLKADEGTKPALIVKATDRGFLYFEAGSHTPHQAPLAQFDAGFEPDVLLLARTSRPAVDADIPLAARPFGFRWFVPEVLKHKKIWRDVLTASLAIQIVGLATPLFTQVVIDKVVVHHTRSTLWVIGIGLAMFMAFNTIMTWLRQYLVLHTGNRVDGVLGQAVVRHLLRLPMPYFEHRPTGVLVARLHGVEQIREFVSGAAVTLLLDCPFLVIFLAVMFWYSWPLTLIALAILLLIAGLSAGVTPIFRAKLSKLFLVGARNTAFVTEYVSGMATVKSLQMEPALEQRYGDLLAEYLTAGLETRQVANTYNVVASALEQVMTLSILVAGALLVMNSASHAETSPFTIGMLVAFQMFTGRLSQPVLRLVGLWQQFQQAEVATKRLGDIMDMPTEPYALVPQRAGTADGRKGGRIEVESISFRYSEQHPWLYRNLSLVIKPGQVSVLVGPSGCGKSTLAKLMLGFYWPAEGRILVDGCDTRHMNANELRTNFGVVPQETTLFAGTVYDNLLMANAQASFAQIVEACRLAEVHEVIEQLPQGYQTPIGEHGVGLSGGQRQRIAIARALLKRPKVLIFDEATSSLDAPTAEQFARTVNALKGQATILFIAHALPRSLLVDEVFSIGRPAEPSLAAPGRTNAQHDHAAPHNSVPPTPASARG
jgi:subfamily B ATP-binding cassette protein HlyB/CyaB